MGDTFSFESDELVHIANSHKVRGYIVSWDGDSGFSQSNRILNPTAKGYSEKRTCELLGVGPIARTDIHCGCLNAVPAHLLCAFDEHRAVV